MTFFVYILQSERTHRYYIGQTDDVPARLIRHNAGYVRSTKHGVPWKLVYQECFPTRLAAMKREDEIKRYKAGIQFKKLLGLY